MTGATVLIHDDHFAPDEQDIKWLKVAGEKGWIVLTKDSRIRYRVLEKTTLMNAGVAAFILTSADLKGNEMAEIFVNALPAISKTIKKYQKPFIANCPVSSHTAHHHSGLGHWSITSGQGWYSTFSAYHSCTKINTAIIVVH